MPTLPLMFSSHGYPRIYRNKTFFKLKGHFGKVPILKLQYTFINKKLFLSQKMKENLIAHAWLDAFK